MGSSTEYFTSAPWTISNLSGAVSKGLVDAGAVDAAGSADTARTTTLVDRTRPVGASPARRLVNGGPDPDIFSPVTGAERAKAKRAGAAEKGAARARGGAAAGAAARARGAHPPGARWARPDVEAP